MPEVGFGDQPDLLPGRRVTSYMYSKGHAFVPGTSYMYIKGHLFVLGTSYMFIKGGKKRTSSCPRSGSVISQNRIGMAPIPNTFGMLAG